MHIHVLNIYMYACTCIMYMYVCLDYMCMLLLVMIEGERDGRVGSRR